MKTILISLVVLILLVGGILFYRDYYVKRKFRKLTLQKYKLIEPLMLKLASKEQVPASEILGLAGDSSMRLALFRTLEAYDRKDLFPAEYFTQEKAAESFLVNWLEFPTELGRSPDEIEFFTKIKMGDSDALSYYVFRYRTISPPWAAKNSWMLGVTGPYQKESMPFDIPLRVFSRFNTVDSISPEIEVKWVHENISQ